MDALDEEDAGLVGGGVEIVGTLGTLAVAVVGVGATTTGAVDMTGTGP